MRVQKLGMQIFSTECLILLVLLGRIKRSTMVRGDLKLLECPVIVISSAVWEELGNPGWNFASVNRHMKAAETFYPASPSDAKMFAADDLISDHGSDGPIQVSFSTYWEPRPLIPAFVGSMASLGINVTRLAVSSKLTFVSEHDLKIFYSQVESLSEWLKHLPPSSLTIVLARYSTRTSY